MNFLFWLTILSAGKKSTDKVEEKSEKEILAEKVIDKCMPFALAIMVIINICSKVV